MNLLHVDGLDKKLKLEIKIIGVGAVSEYLAAKLKEKVPIAEFSFFAFGCRKVLSSNGTIGFCYNLKQVDLNNSKTLFDTAWCDEFSFKKEFENLIGRSDILFIAADLCNEIDLKAGLFCAEISKNLSKLILSLVSASPSNQGEKNFRSLYENGVRKIGSANNSIAWINHKQTAEIFDSEESRTKSLIRSCDAMRDVIFDFADFSSQEEIFNSADVVSYFLENRINLVGFGENAAGDSRKAFLEAFKQAYGENTESKASEGNLLFIRLNRGLKVSEGHQLVDLIKKVETKNAYRVFNQIGDSTMGTKVRVTLFSRLN